MARADYFGTGQSATRHGIHIQPYTLIGGDLPECRANQPCCEGCFEASWDEKGARCIAHLRIQEITQRNRSREHVCPTLTATMQINGCHVPGRPDPCPLVPGNCP
jgi:hypothetical protein